MPTEEDIKEQRKREADELDIYMKAETVVKRLGKQLGGCRHTWLSCDNAIQILLDDHATNPNLYIRMAAGNIVPTICEMRLVYAYEGKLEAYRPDIPDWREILQYVYESLLPAIEKEEKEKDQKHRAEVFDAWGIKPG